MKQLSTIEILIISLLVFSGLITACSIGGSEKIIADYTRAIELNPDDPNAYNNRGLAYSKSGDLKQAIADYTKAIELDPVFALAYYLRGFVYSKSGDLEKAIADYERYLEVAPNAPNREEVINIIKELKSKLGQ